MFETKRQGTICPLFLYGPDTHAPLTSFVASVETALVMTILLERRLGRSLSQTTHLNFPHNDDVEKKENVPDYFPGTACREHQKVYDMVIVKDIVFIESRVSIPALVKRVNRYGENQER